MNNLLNLASLIFLLFITLSFSVSAEQFISPFGQAFVKIKAGEFIMGTQNFDLLAKEVKPSKLNRLKKELPPHKVTISRDFWLATTEITQAIWFKVMGTKPGKKKRWQREDWAQLPVNRISWDSVQMFIKTLNKKDDSYRYRLPTEAEWEYSARAGTYGLRPFPFETMDEYAWYRSNSGNKPMPVATLKPNAWGLYDMIGNMWEWVEDSYEADYYSNSPIVDPKGPEVFTLKVMRGGSYHCTAERARVGIRGSRMGNRKMSVLGFRLAADKK